MQNLFNIKKMLLLLLLSITATSRTQASLQDSQENANNELTQLLNAMSLEDQQQFKRILGEIEELENKSLDPCKKKSASYIKNLTTTIKNAFNTIPYGAKVAEFSLYLMLAIFLWEYIQPKAKEMFPGWETATELPKAIGGVLIVDSMKDVIKELKQFFSEKICPEDETAAIYL